MSKLNMQGLILVSRICT